MIDKKTILDVLLFILRKNGMTCQECAFKESNLCLHAEMKLSRTNTIKIDDKTSVLLDNFTIPHNDFFCKFWTEDAR